MRLDQYEKLQALAERLSEVVVNDADPQHWVGTGKKPNELTQQERGDAYWCRKMAVASIGVLMRVETLIGKVQQVGAGDAPPEPAEGDEPEDTDALLDRDIASAEREAAKLLGELQTGARKKKFDAGLNAKP